MTLEKKLINKSYYITFMESKENVHPIEALGEMYMVEQQNEVTDLSAIRFAQGEVYFQYKDYEAAIFKWENISIELAPWAQKNIADAHFELDLLAIAEDYYKAIETDSSVLKSEVLLQLFSLYVRLGKLELAAGSIKDAVELNPDYPEVTDMARSFFEEREDYRNAIELACNEAIRTHSISWFSVLETYVREGRNAGIKPSYFREVLETLYDIDLASFESLSAAQWESYRQTDLFFPWLQEINQLLLDKEPAHYYGWNQLTEIYHETYNTLIDGNYLISELSPIIPNYLSNWMKISSGSDKLISASALLAWSDLFPDDLEVSMTDLAKTEIGQSSAHLDVLDDGLRLFQTVKNWALDKGVFLDKRFEWTFNELIDFRHSHILVAGTGKGWHLDIVNNLLQDDLLDASTSAAMFIKNRNEAEYHAINEEETITISGTGEMKEMAKKQQTLISCKIPSSFLEQNKLALIVSPRITSQSTTRVDTFPSLPMADRLLFVLDAASPLTGQELDMAVTISEKNPMVPVHFLLNRNNKAESELLEDTTKRIHHYFPNAKILSISSGIARDEISTFLHSLTMESRLEEERAGKVLYYVKESIEYLAGKRVKMENQLAENIKWNEEMVTKLTGAVHQLRDMEDEKINALKSSYREIKAVMREDLLAKIPELIRNCADLIDEESDFDNINKKLNDAMNQKINSYLEETAQTSYHKAMENWIVESNQELKDAQEYLDDIRDSFNHLYGEEKLSLSCDFQVLDDWIRDTDRMTRGSIQLEKSAILTRSNPSQLLMKSAERLLGAFSQNKGVLINKYRQFIENKDYSGTAQSITDRFMQQFELFEHALDRDVHMFFANPFEVLNRIVEETQQEVKENKHSLNTMRENPEQYRDPLTLFRLKLLQYERMETSDNKVVHEYH
ncbi:GTP-binding protein [Oceanobacillus massiliensis]|uniref:GTP-binding protein n=1 Tax=Oceanobacillus massiliensis TaxID=1465765 RepID=UPI0030175AF5